MYLGMTKRGKSWGTLMTVGTSVAVAASLSGCGSTVTQTRAESGQSNGTSETAETIGAAAALGQEEPADGQKKPAETAGQRPNIVYIVLDDMGYSDLGCYGSTIETPNIDQLAKQGIQYSNYFTTPLSSPSRAALLTGCEPNVLGMGTTSDVDLGDEVPNMRARIYPQHGTLAEILDMNQYNTMAAGKWHLAPYDEFLPDSDKANWPSGKGFRKNYNFITSQTSQWEPGGMILGDSYTEADITKEGYHLTNDIVDTSLRFVDELQDENPFFLYFAPGAMHSPLQAPDSYIEKYRGRYDEGWDVEREKRFAKQKELGLFPEDAALPERNPDTPAWDELTEDEKKIAARHMEVYAGFLEHTDAQIGRMFDGLKERGLYDNTLFVLVSDNGSNSKGGVYGNPNGHAVENVYDFSVEEQLDLMDEFGGRVYGDGYNTGWAMASNTPFRMYKFSSLYGGVRTACITAWKDGIRNPGRICSEVLDVTDITPTVLDILRIQAPDEIKGIKQEEMNGSSFAELVDQNERTEKRKDIYVHMGPECAIAAGDGYMAATNPLTGEWELYDMENDPTQAYDLAEEQPEELERLKELHRKERRENYNGGNLVMDFMQGASSDEIIRTYGGLGESVINALTKGELPGEEAAEYVRILRLSAIDHNRGTILFVPKDSALYGKEFKYTRDMDFFSSLAGARTNAVSHEITIPVKRDQDQQEGVLIANGGGYDGGYSIYIKDDKLCYVYNFVGEQQKIVSEADVPEADFTAAVAYEKLNLYEGNISLFIDGEKVGGKKIKTLPMFTSYDYMSIGQDAGSKVSSDYKDNFNYQGDIGEIVITLGDDLAQKNERP